MLDNLGEAVLIAQALVTLDLIPYGEVRAPAPVVLSLGLLTYPFSHRLACPL